MDVVVVLAVAGPAGRDFAEKGIVRYFFVTCRPPFSYNLP